jgi:hypothetical protein
MFKIIKRHNVFIFTAINTLIASVAVIYVHFGYQNSTAISKLEAREKLDAFMADVRIHHSARCDVGKNILRPIWKQRYEALIDVAKIDASTSPYNTLCTPLPSPPELLSISGRATPSFKATKYDTWNSFIKSDEKKSVLWVGDVPIQIDVSSLDFGSSENENQIMLDEIKKCENKEQSKPENTFVKASCAYTVDDANEVVMYQVINIK